MVFVLSMFLLIVYFIIIAQKNNLLDGKMEYDIIVKIDNLLRKNFFCYINNR